MSQTNELQPEVAAKYDCSIEPTAVIIQKPKRKTVDLRLISVIEADNLVEEGFPFLSLKPLKDNKAKPTPPAKDKD